MSELINAFLTRIPCICVSTMLTRHQRKMATVFFAVALLPPVDKRCLADASNSWHGMELGYQAGARRSEMGGVRASGALGSGGLCAATRASGAPSF